MGKASTTVIVILSVVCVIHAAEYHVSPGGFDSNPGSESQPFRTINAAAQIAEPGDVITVHEGIYRERVNPRRGGSSAGKRIVYQAAAGEKVAIRGSEVVKGWERVEHDTWRVTLPNSFFGAFNPFDTLISGDWFHRQGRDHHTGAVYFEDVWLKEAKQREDVLKAAGVLPMWFAEVSESATTIWAQFKDVDPNPRGVEVNVRQTVFYPEKPGMNYITVRGFVLEHAATPWAPPTAEQMGLIGTHWSKGWIIEDNTVRYSACAGIALGKYGDAFDNKAESAKGYVGTIMRALKNGWSKENIGHHVVRNNHISHCGQVGIVGSLGAVFSTVSGNEIHDIHRNCAFSGHEIAGIKFHGPIDTVISGNHIYRCGGVGGMWLDWMTQGTRVTGNLLHDNTRDLFVEVNHGPFVVDNNVFLSGGGLLESCGGGAYAHNLFGGRLQLRQEKSRETPFHKGHSTEVLGLSKVVDDDERFHNNLFVKHQGLCVYDQWDPVNLQAFGNVYVGGAKPSVKDCEELVAGDFDCSIKLIKKDDGWWMEMAVDPGWVSKRKRAIVTTETLGKAKVSQAPYEKPDGTAYRLARDYFGEQRRTENPAAGPFAAQREKAVSVKVWPKE